MTFPPKPLAPRSPSHGGAAVRKRPAPVTPGPAVPTPGPSPVQLRFETCWSFPYPVATTGFGTALTLCRRNNDPYLAFLTQTGHDDEVVYCAYTGQENFRHPTPPTDETISGMAWDPFRQVIWCSQSTNANRDTIIAFDPETGVLTDDLSAPISTAFGAPQGLACNGFFFARGGGPYLELWTTGGFLVGTREYPGRGITGVSAAPWSFAFCDAYRDEIVVIGPLGNELAVSSGVGTSQGMDALAFNYVTHHEMEDYPQVWLEDGTIGDPGTIYHPDTPWNPVPWGGRHRLYIANHIDQTVYAGYLTAAP